MESNNTDNNARYIVVCAYCDENMSIDIETVGPFHAKDEAWKHITGAYSRVLKDFEMWEDEPEGKRIDEYLGVAEIVGECTSTHWEIIEIK